MTGIPMDEQEQHKLEAIFARITECTARGIQQITEKYGDEPDDNRYYDTYQADSDYGKFIIKKASDREAYVYETYLSDNTLPVPRYYGKHCEADETWIVIENVEGTDLRDMTDSLAVGCADCLARVQNKYWDGVPGVSDIHDNRFEIYWKRILKRAVCAADDKTLRQAYQLFLDRQLTCPLTLSHGDFMPCNVMQADGDITIIDWGFSGRMPYSLDIARFIAHATVDRATFPFYMNDHQKELFVSRVYEKLNNKPDYDRYRMDIKLAVLNEYIEFVEADEDEDQWYYNHAVKLASSLI